MKIETWVFVIIGVMTLVLTLDISLNFLLWLGVGITELTIAYLFESEKITSLR